MFWCRLGRPEHGVALDGYPVGVLDGAEAGGYPGFAGGDGLAVAAAVGAFGQALAVVVRLRGCGLRVRRRGRRRRRWRCWRWCRPG